MAAAIFQVDYVNGVPDLPALEMDVPGWSYWAEEEVTTPNQEQVLMHIEHEHGALIEQMKGDPKYTFVEDILPPDDGN